MRKADYGQIAATYDAARPLSDQNLDLWVDLISRRIGSRRRIEFLDLGCGTGRFTFAIAARPGYSVTGADVTIEMLRKAREKEEISRISWMAHDAVFSPYLAESFDAVFMSHLLHHVHKPKDVVRECYRILKPAGVVLNRYGAIENIRDDPEHRFFPETVEIDEARIPSTQQVQDWFTDAGFKEISSETIYQHTYESVKEILDRMTLKPTSVLTLISQSAFEQGLERLQRYLSSNPNDPWLYQDRLTLSVGRKS